MIVDTHVHVYPPAIRENRKEIAGREPYFDLLTRGSAHRWGTAEDVLAAMDEDGVGQSWICGFAFSDIGLCRDCNDYVLGAASSSNGRLKAMIVVPPLARGMEDEIARCARLGAIGVGELFPDGQNFPLDDPRATWRLAAVCQENNLFLSLHCAEPVGRQYPGKGSVGPREAYAAALAHPELRIVLAHWGGGLFMYEQMPDVRADLRNVWYDSAATPFLYTHSIYDAAAAAGVGGKILYGSDFPLLRLPRYQKMLDESGMSASQKEAYFSENAKVLAGI